MVEVAKFQIVKLNFGNRLEVGVFFFGVSCSNFPAFFSGFLCLVGRRMQPFNH